MNSARAMHRMPERIRTDLRVLDAGYLNAIGRSVAIDGPLGAGAWVDRLNCLSESARAKPRQPLF